MMSARIEEGKLCTTELKSPYSHTGPIPTRAPLPQKGFG